MAIMKGRSVLLLALLATLSGAARVEMKIVSEHMKAGSRGLGRLRAEHPDVTGLSMEAQKVIDAKVEKAAAAQQAAMDALMNLGSAQVGVPSGVDGKDNNTHKRNITKDMVDALHAANVEKKIAMDVKAAVESMIKACKDLFDFAANHAGARERTLVDKAEATATAESDFGELLGEVIEAEQEDLALLIGKIDEIRKAQQEVQTANETAKAGSREGVDAAAKLVYEFAGQLEDRQTGLLKTQTFEDWPELMSSDIKTEIDPHTSAALAKALTHLDAVIEEHTSTLAKAMEQMTVLGSSTKDSNRTAMMELVQQQFDVNIKKAAAEELKRKVEHFIELVNAFFAQFAAYEAEFPVKQEIAKGNAQEIVDKKDELHTQADLSELMALSAIYEFYQTMWLRYAEANAPMPSDDEAYATLAEDAKSKAEEIHVWVNKEFHYLCEYYGTCGDARAKVLALLETENAYCDKRGDEGVCLTQKNGRQPDGKMCMWTDACAQNDPPTTNLQYGEDHPDGAGLFY